MMMDVQQGCATQGCGCIMTLAGLFILGVMALAALA